MDASSIITILIGLSAVIGLPLSAWSRSRNGRKKAGEFHQHLQNIGVKCVLLPEFAAEQTTNQKRSLGQKSVGTIKLSYQIIDSITVVGQIQQYGVHYLLDYCVRRENMVGGGTRKKTKLHRKKHRKQKDSLGGESTEIEWRGDDFLAQRLTADYALRHMLIETMPECSIEILPDHGHDYVRIRTGYIFPSPEAFRALNMIANHVKSW